MKSFFIITLITLAALAQTQTSPTASDLIVVKFSCGLQQNRSSMIRSVQDPGPSMNEPMRINPQSRNEPQEVKNRRDMQERRADLRAAEMNASISNQPQTKIYTYRLRVKNTGTKQIKRFAWEYHPANSADPIDRQFLCAIGSKPNESKDLELFSPLAPSRVVDAANAGDKSTQNSDGKVLINKIEYADGSIWLRPGWNTKIFSEEAANKVEKGKCIGL